LLSQNVFKSRVSVVSPVGLTTEKMYFEPKCDFDIFSFVLLLTPTFRLSTQAFFNLVFASLVCFLPGFPLFATLSFALVSGESDFPIFDLAIFSLDSVECFLPKK